MIQNVKKQFIFKHISIWLSGLRGQALGEVISGSKPGFVDFMFLSCLVLAVLVLPFATMLVSELNYGHLRCDIFHFLERKICSAAKVN
jgi:ABC-type phosphate transport system permease subunit